MAAKKTSARKATEPGDGPAGEAGLPPARRDRLHVSQVRQLVGLMVANDLTSLEIVNGDLKVSLGRGGALPGMPAAAPSGAARPAGEAWPPPPVAPPPEPPAEKFLEIKSPMVGTFYSAPSPDSEPYVTGGTRVADDTVVCIVEAMKVMNEIKAECRGTVIEVAAKNGQPVEYGQVLYRVRPDGA